MFCSRRLATNKFANSFAVVTSAAVRNKLSAKSANQKRGTQQPMKTPRSIALVAVALAISSVQAAVEIIGGPVINTDSGHIYYLLSESSWPDAEIKANQLGGYLAAINSQAEQDWVFKNFGAFGGNTNRSLWIGLHKVDGVWVWSSGEPVTYTYWAPGEPNDVNGREDASSIDAWRWTPPGQWNDAESGLASATSSERTVTYNGLVEVSPSPAWVQWPQSEGGNGHWYSLTRQEYRGWAQAEAEAQTYPNGHLASVNSTAEQKFIEAAFLSGHSVSNTFWIGFNDFAQEGKWVWSSGEPTSYTHWLTGEPNNQASEDGALLNWSFWAGYGDFGTWADYPENYLAHYGLIEVQDTSPPVRVEVDPESQTVPPKGTAGFRAWTYGLGSDLQYRWQFQGSDIPSATEQTLVLRNLSRLQTGFYRVIVSRPGMESLTSKPAWMVVAGPPVIVRQPVSRVVAEGENVEFSVAVDGEGPFSYEWRLNGTPLIGAREPTLSLSNVKSTQTGNYSARVSNPDGSTLSTSAKLTVIPVGFTVVYANDIEGAVGPEWVQAKKSLTPLGARKFLGEYGNEQVVLTVSGLPSHSEILLSYDVYTIRSWDGNDPDSGPDIFETSLVGGSTLLQTTFCNTYNDWQHGYMRQSYPLNHPEGSFPERTGAREVNTMGYNTTGSWYGEYGDSVYNVAHIFDHSNPTIGIVFRGQGLESVTDESWGLDNVVLAVRTTFPASPPEILLPPTTEIVRKGETAVFRVLASGSGPLKYRWRFEQDEIPNATAAILTVKEAQAANAGRYSVIVENDFGLISRSPAELTVVTEMPTSQNVNATRNAVLTVGFSGNASVQWQFDGTDLPGRIGKMLVVPDVRRENAGLYSAVLNNGAKSFEAGPVHLAVPVGGEPGSTVWATQVGAWLYTTPAIGLDGTIYVAKVNQLEALDHTGKRKWTLGLPISRGSPAIGVDGTVLVAGYEAAKLFAVWPDGNLRWEFPTSRKYFVATPAIGADGTIYIGEQDWPEGTHQFYAVNPDGSKRWEVSIEGRISQAAVGADGSIYLKAFPGGQETRLYALGPDGQTRWICEIQGPAEGSLAIGPDGTIYSGSAAGILYAISRQGEVLWRLGMSSSTEAPAVGSDGTIYISTIWSSELFAVAPDGSLRRSVKYADFAYSAPTVDQLGNVYVSADHQELMAIGPSGQQLWEYWTGSQRWHAGESRRPQPVLSTDGTIYYGATLPDGTAKLYAIVASASGGSAAWPMPWHDPQHTSRMPLLLEATNLNVSVGANVVMRATMSEQPPVQFQWYHNGNPVAEATNQVLNLTGVSAEQAGDYQVAMTYANGTALSHAVQLLVDGTFTKITAGPVATNTGDSVGVAWGDCDGDGWQDLFVANSSLQDNFLYHNNGNGTFTRIVDAPPVLEPGAYTAGVWGDYDNDGRLDLFVAQWRADNCLFRGDGKSGFETILTGSIVNDGGSSHGAAWGDYDQDGSLDLFVLNHVVETEEGKNFLYHNLGEGVFARVTTGSVVSDPGQHASGTWADYDGDGDIDLFVTDWIPGGHNKLFRNGEGKFTKITMGPLVTDSGTAQGAAWADYDNDGDLDLFVAYVDEPSRLYRNDGAGVFTPADTEPLTSDISNGCSPAWGDYDNDSDLDLFVSNMRGQGNRLYQNNGDGTFSSVTNGSIVHDLADSYGAAWADYDNDGFLDLVVANRSFYGYQTKATFLYRNNGNANHWLKLRLTGTLSNTSAIGAKVRVKAASRGHSMWQLREISGGSGYCSQNALDSHFGLGDADRVEALRIEWPSGLVQEYENIGVNQFLTITEPPLLTPVGMSWPGEFEMVLTSRGGFDYAIEATADFVTWTEIGQLLQVNGSIQFVDDEAALHSWRLYRAVQK